MRPYPKAEAERWLVQARSDLGFAEVGAREGVTMLRPASCAQQAAEKALKALHYLGGERLVIGHSLLELLRALLTRHPSLADLEEAARRLDQYYVPTRYPNGLPGGTPADVFSKAQAAEALAQAKQFVEVAGALIG